MNKLALGTAQFGLKYGIQNTKGQIEEKKVGQILKYAFNHKIDLLDTAYAYGKSEEIIGTYMRSQKLRFKIVSKIPSCKAEKILSYLQKTLKNLQLPSIYGYLFHDFSSYQKSQESLNVVQNIQKQGLVKKIGFSLYYPRELEYILKRKIQFNIIQIPYNVFDQRFVPYFPILKKMKIKIHVRSVFLQGLLFMKPDKLPKQFSQICTKLEKLNDLSKEIHLPISVLLIGFALLNSNIDNVIIGVDSIENLKENLKNIPSVKKLNVIMSELTRLRVSNEKILLPIHWKQL